MNVATSLAYPTMNPSKSDFPETYQFPISMEPLSFTEHFGTRPLSEQSFSTLPFTLPTSTSLPPQNPAFPSTENMQSMPAQQSFSLPTMPAFPPTNETPFENFDPQHRLSVSNVHVPTDVAFPLLPNVNDPAFSLHQTGTFPQSQSRRTSHSHGSSPHSEISSVSSTAMPTNFRRYSVMDDILSNAPIPVQRRSSLPTPFFPSIYMDGTQTGLQSSLVFPQVMPQSAYFGFEDSASFPPSAEHLNALQFQGSPAIQAQQLMPTSDNATLDYSSDIFSSPALSTISLSTGQHTRRRSSLVPSTNGEYLCPYPNCNKSFSRSHSLKSHMVMHSNIKPFKCPYCPLAMRRNHDLRRHMRLHSGSKPFSCTRCGKSFSRSDALKRHKKVDACTEYNPKTFPNSTVVA